MNNVQLIGRLTADPEKRQTASGGSVASFTLAVDRRGKDGGTDFIRCKAFNKAADTIAQYMSKGRRFAVGGRIQTGSYENRDGQKVNTFEVIVDTFDFIDSTREQAAPQRATRPAPQRSTAETFDHFLAVPDGIDNELPFE